MASYPEILAASINTTLRDKTIVACLMAAEVVRTEDAATPNHAARMTWAKRVYQNPEEEAKLILRSMLVQTQTANPAVTLSQLTGASDAAVLAAALNAINAVA